MKVSIASYDNTTDTHNSFSEITEALDFNIQHSFNTPARCTITISDSDGSLHQTYVDSSGTVYMGSGRVKVEEPTGNTVFDGRLMKCRHDSNAGKTYLLCYDWLHQLVDERVTYDMREELDTGIRKGTLSADFDRTFEAVYTSGASHYAYDRNIVFSDDEYNGYKMIIPSDIGSGIKTTIGPYAVDCPTLDDEITDAELNEMWVEDTNLALAQHSTAGTFTINFDFKLNVTEGSLYNSFEGAQLKLIYGMSNSDSAKIIMDNAARDDSEELITGLGNTNGYLQTETADISTSIWDSEDWVNAAGEVRIKIEWTVAGGVIDQLKIYYLVLEFEADVDTYSSIIAISKVAYDHQFTVGTNLDTAALGLWEDCPYCIVDEIYTHISTLTSAGAQLVSLSTSVESNNRYSTRKFSEKTRLEILKALSAADRAQFWITPGGTTLNWKSTFDGGTTNIGDSDVLAWTTAERDFEPLRNEYHLYGQRIGDNQLSLDTSDLDTDPGADSKALYDLTRSEVIKGTGATSEPELEDLGNSIVKRNDDVRFHLRASVAGYSHEIGTELNVSSTILGLTDQKYVVTQFQYDSKSDRTQITLHPRVNVGYQNWKPMGSTVSDVKDTAEDARVDTYVPKVL